jgi:Cytochrome c
MRYFLLYSSLCVVLFCTAVLLRDNWSAFIWQEPLPDGCGTISKKPLFRLHSERGQVLFLTKCAACHNPNPNAKCGNMLKDVTKRWSGRGTLLYDFIKDGDKVKASGDTYVNALYIDYSNTTHPVFSTLSNKDISEILLFVERQ